MAVVVCPGSVARLGIHIVGDDEPPAAAGAARPDGDRCCDCNTTQWRRASSPVTASTGCRPQAGRRGRREHPAAPDPPVNQVAGLLARGVRAAPVARRLRRRVAGRRPGGGAAESIRLRRIDPSTKLPGNWRAQRGARVKRPSRCLLLPNRPPKKASASPPLPSLLMSFDSTLHDKAIQLTKLTYEITGAAGSGHPSSGASLAHLVAVLLYQHMRFEPMNPGHPASDRLVLSEGHAVPVLYAAMADLGIAYRQSKAPGDAGDLKPMTYELACTLREIDSIVDGHPNPALGFPFFDAATGSLGQGLSVAAGLALAARMDGLGKRIFCLIGDGESREGQVWEAIDFLRDHDLKAVCPVFNANHYAQSAAVSEQQSADVLVAKLQAAGFDVQRHRRPRPRGRRRGVLRSRPGAAQPRGRSRRHRRPHRQGLGRRKPAGQRPPRHRAHRRRAAGGAGRARREAQAARRHRRREAQARPAPAGEARVRRAQEDDGLRRGVQSLRPGQGPGEGRARHAEGLRRRAAGARPRPRRRRRARRRRLRLHRLRFFQEGSRTRRALHRVPHRRAEHGLAPRWA